MTSEQSAIWANNSRAETSSDPFRTLSLRRSVKTSHYLRSYTVQEIDASGAASLAADVAVLAEAEGLPAHAAAARAAGAAGANRRASRAGSQSEGGS
jgi:hypothetical protein